MNEADEKTRHRMWFWREENVRSNNVCIVAIQNHAWCFSQPLHLSLCSAESVNVCAGVEHALHLTAFDTYPFKQNPLKIKLNSSTHFVRQNGL